MTDPNKERHGKLECIRKRLIESIADSVYYQDCLFLMREVERLEQEVGEQQTKLGQLYIAVETAENLKADAEQRMTQLEQELMKLRIVQ